MSKDQMLRDGPVDRREWAWATELAAPEWTTTVQLMHWLERGDLPPHTLVWKQGWGEWLPALQVAEFASAFPSVTAGNRRVARVAFNAAATPPPVPVSEYPRLRLLARDVIRDSVIRDSSGPYPAVISRGFPAAQEPTLVRYLDADHTQQELVTRQVPAAAMLQAARAMQAPDRATRPSQRHRRSKHEPGNFGETAASSSTQPPSTQPSSTQPPRSLAALEVELGAAAPPARKPGKSRRASSGYVRWISFGLLVGSALGALTASELWPRAAALTSILSLNPQPAAALLPLTLPATLAEERHEPTLAPAMPVPAALPQQPVAPPVPSTPAVSTRAPAAHPKPGRIRVSRGGDPAVLRALRVTANDGFDRVVFEFGERVPGYRIEYIDGPARDCDSGQTRRVEGSGRLELRFYPARAHDESGEPTFRPRELKPALGMVRELERSCDRNDVVSWVIGTTAANRYRAYEMTAPPRLVVQIEH